MKHFSYVAAVLPLALGCSEHGMDHSDESGMMSDQMVPKVIETPPWDGAFNDEPAVDESEAPDVVEVSLEATEASVEIAPGKTVKLWTYNGLLPGPRIEANVGDTVRVHFKNSLPEETTIHWHGLRIPAAMDGVSVTQTPVAPGEEFTYEFVISDSGTFWYHPHVRSDEQVERGLYGSIVVRDADEPAVTSESTVVLDDILLDDSWALAEFSDMEAMVGRQGNVLLANGHASPVAHLNAGGLHRMRFVNAANARYFRLSPGQEFWVLGYDGARLEKPELVTETLLVPGARVDVAFEGRASGETLTWSTLSYERGHETGVSPDAQVFTVAFDGEAEAAPALPARFAELPTFDEATQTRELALEESMGGSAHAGHGGSAESMVTFSINGETFPDIEPLSANLGATEEWRITNTTMMDHPFHLHGFRFEVIGVDGVAPPYRALQDTVNIGAEQTVTLRVPLEGFPGSWMFHCHILEHAELGMMGQLDVTE